jgi:hypothetical protein
MLSATQIMELQTVAQSVFVIEKVQVTVFSVGPPLLIERRIWANEKAEAAVQVTTRY